MRLHKWYPQVRPPPIARFDVLWQFVLNYICKCTISLNLQKWVPTRSQVCHTELVKAALGSSALALRMVGQTPKSNNLRPISSLLKRLICQIVGNNSCDFFQISTFDHFKSAENGSKWSDFDILPTVGCASVGNLQRTFTQRLMSRVRT